MRVRNPFLLVRGKNPFLTVPDKNPFLLAYRLAEYAR